MKHIRNATFATVAAALALAACNDHTFVPKPEDAATNMAGVYSGTLAADPAGAEDFEAIVLDDGTFWVLYGQDDGTSFAVQGFARGSGVLTEGVFTSTAGADFGFVPSAAFSLEADYDTDTGTFEGSYTTVAGTTTFEGGPLEFSDYDFTTAPDLATLSGSWDVEDMLGILYTLDVATDGTFDFTEQGGGCTGNGTFSPHDSGRNVFDVSVDFDNVVDCASPGGSATGIAIAYTISGAGADQLIGAIDDGDLGLVVFGTRPSL